MTKEELFFKENYPEYVTEKGEYLTPYWDLFRAGVICATFELKVKIEQFEKENAELRKDKKELCHSISEGGKACVYLNEQLTKAKEIIEKLISQNRKEWIYSDVREEAEQFLKECEE